MQGQQGKHAARIARNHGELARLRDTTRAHSLDIVQRYEYQSFLALFFWIVNKTRPASTEPGGSGQGHCHGKICRHRRIGDRSPPGQNIAPDQYRARLLGDDTADEITLLGPAEHFARAGQLAGSDANRTKYCAKDWGRDPCQHPCQYGPTE